MEYFFNFEKLAYLKGDKPEGCILCLIRDRSDSVENLTVYETNPRAIRAYQKAGFKEEGRLREGHYFNGKYIDIIVMSVLRSEWVDA